MKLFFLIFVSLAFMGCKNKKEKVISSYEKVVVDENLVHNDTIQLLSKFPELRLFRKEKMESKTRTAYIVQNSGHRNFWLRFDNYKCKATKEDDTLRISLSNYDGMISNGVLIKIFNGHFYIKDYDPKTLKGGIKFFNSKPEYQIVKLNKREYQKKDSIFGFIDYKCVIGGGELTKMMRGYFKTAAQ